MIRLVKILIKKQNFPHCWEKCYKKLLPVKNKHKGMFLILTQTADNTYYFNSTIIINDPKNLHVMNIHTLLNELVYYCLTAFKEFKHKACLHNKIVLFRYKAYLYHKIVLFRYKACLYHKVVLFRCKACLYHKVVLFRYKTCSYHKIVLFRYNACLSCVGAG